MCQLATRCGTVTCVVNQDALLDGVNEVEHVPYGFLLWESAVVLAQQLVTGGTALRGNSMELGAGVGLADWWRKG